MNIQNFKSSSFSSSLLSSTSWCCSLFIRGVSCYLSQFSPVKVQMRSKSGSSFVYRLWQTLLVSVFIWPTAVTSSYLQIQIQTHQWGESRKPVWAVVLPVSSRCQCYRSSVSQRSDGRDFTAVRHTDRDPESKLQEQWSPDNKKTNNNRLMIEWGRENSL